MEYEGLHRICTTCGCYGHLTRECKQSLGSKSAAPMIRQAAGVMSENSNAATSLLKNLVVNEAINLGGSNKSKMEENKEPVHGDWLTVKRKN